MLRATLHSPPRRPQNSKELERKESYITRVRSTAVTVDCPKTKKTVSSTSRSFGFENVSRVTAVSP